MNWGRRAVWSIAGLAVLVMLWLLGAAIIPRWWAQRVGDVVGGRLTVGALYGGFIGFVFTALPLACLAAAIRLRSRVHTWKGWVAWLFAAAVLAAPNLMTLGVTWGRGNAAHDGDRILSVEGTGFRMGSLVGAIVAGAAAAGLAYLTKTRGLFKSQNRRLRNALHD
ncbi:MAG TPA: hypothetical protein VNQ73_18800 [Ilumatobacter sp.]|nr:hypothetical protein [Ilumatobacter sp.]